MLGPFHGRRYVPSLVGESLLTPHVLHVLRDTIAINLLIYLSLSEVLLTRT